MYVLKRLKARESDRIDLIGDMEDKTRKRSLKRVILYKILDEKTRSNRPKVILISWKNGLTEDDLYKSY